MGQKIVALGAALLLSTTHHPSLARRPSTVLVQDSRLPEGEVKTTGKRAPVKSTWPDQSHSSSTRGHHRTSYLKWRTRRISPSLISTRRNFCIDVPPVSVYTGKAARRRRQGNFSDAHPSTWRAERGLNKESAYSETEYTHRHTHIHT